MKTIRSVVFLAAIAAPLFAQQKLVETIEVRVVNVDVVVTDHAGNPIPGLTKDDFQLFENGKPQPITNLYEIRPEAATPAAAAAVAQATAPAAIEPPAELRARRFVMFVDNYSLHPFKRNEVLKSLAKFIDDQMRPGDEAELVLWTRSLSVVTPFTSDKQLLKAGMVSLSQRSRSGMSIQAEIDRSKRRIQDYYDAAREQKIRWPDALNSARGEAEAFAEQAWADSRMLLEALRLTSTTLAGLDGRKVLVLAGAHLPENPGSELAMFVYQLFAPFVRNLSPADAVLSNSRTQTFSLEKLARQANADGVTFYTIDAADSRDTFSAEQAQATDSTEEFMTFTNTAMAYQLLANITGGVSISNTPNFDLAFDAVARDLGAYYSLGYKPLSDVAGNRKIVVKTKNPAYRVRARQTYMPKTAEEQINDRVVANIYHASMKSDWPISVRTGTPAPQGDRFAVPIEITLPATVTLLPQGDELVGGFTVYIAVGTDSGAMSKVTKSEEPIRIPKAAEAGLRSKPMSFTATIVVRPGDSTLSVAAVDQLSNTTGLARTRIAAK